MPKPLEMARVALSGAVAAGLMMAAPPAFATSICAANPTGARAAGDAAAAAARVARQRGRAYAPLEAAISGGV